MKFLGTIKAKSIVVHTILKAVEHHLTERELESDEYAASISLLDAGMPEAQEVESLSSKLHHLLGDLTIQEANARVRRCRGESDMLAWKRLTAIHNPKTLASGLKALMAVHNPPKICDIKKADIQIEEWKPRWSPWPLNTASVYRGKSNLQCYMECYHRRSKSACLTSAVPSGDSSKMMKLLERHRG